MARSSKLIKMADKLVKGKLSLGRYSFSKLHLLFFILVFAAIGGYLIYRSSAAGIYYISPSGNDANSCSQSQPCVSFNRAYIVASPGDTVEVAGGNYGNQSMSYDSTKTSNEDIVFRPADGATVNVGVFDMGTNKTEGPRHITLNGFGFKISSLKPKHAQDLTFINLDVGDTQLSSSQDISYVGGDYGPRINGTNNVGTCGGDLSECGSPVSGNTRAARVIFDGVYFHDYLVTNYELPLPNGFHSECIQTAVGPGISDLTIRNSIFQNCQDFGMRLEGVTGGLIENNFIDDPFLRVVGQESATCSPNCPRGGNSIVIDNRTTADNVIVRYNTALGGISHQLPGGVLMGNIGRKTSCYNPQGNVYSYNIWSGAACSATDKQTDIFALLVDSDPSDGTMDLHLKAGTVAIGAGDPVIFPSTDIDGQSRPQGATADAGADEREMSGPATALWLSTAGNDSTCVRGDATKPCQTLNKAYQVAQLGDVVEIGCGNYPGEVISYQASKDIPSSQYVTFRPASNCGVNGVYLGYDGTEMQVRSPHIRLIGSSKLNSNFRINKWLMQKTNTNAVEPYHFWLEKVHAHSVYARSADDVTVKDSELGPALFCHPDGAASLVANPDDYECPLPATTDYPQGARGNTSFGLNFKTEGVYGSAPSNTVLDNVLFHDANSRDIDGGANSTFTTGLHTECVFFAGGDTVTVRNSEFVRCGAFGIFFQAQNLETGGEAFTTENVIIENNFFSGPVDAVDGGRATGDPGINAARTTNNAVIPNADISVSLLNANTENLTNWLVRFNSFRNGFQLNNGGSGTFTFTNVRVIGNIGEFGGPCSAPGLTVDFNAWYNRAPFFGSTTCGTNYRALTSDPFMSVGLTQSIGQRPDMHLVGSCACENFIIPTSSDYAIGTDIDGQPRTAPRDAGADEFSTVTPPPPDTTAPSVPTNLRLGGSVTTTSIPLAWNASTDTGGSGLAGYRLYRGSTSLPLTTTTLLSFLNSGLTPDTSYSYTIAAYDNAGNQSAKSPTLSLRTNAPPPTPLPAPPPRLVPAYVKAADLNDDGRITIRDVSILLRYYRTNNIAADINDDGEVNIRDVSKLLAKYGQRVN
jgi:chitodextrinase